MAAEYSVAHAPTWLAPAPPHTVPPPPRRTALHTGLLDQPPPDTLLVMHPRLGRCRINASDYTPEMGEIIER